MIRWNPDDDPERWAQREAFLRSRVLATPKRRTQPCRIRGNEFAHGFLIRHLHDDVLRVEIKGVTYYRQRRRDAIGYPTFEALR